jgi:hypothetical protein
MSDAIDTSAEAVEAKAQVLDVPDDVLSVTQTQKAARHSAAMLRALLAERDENEKAAAVWRGRTKRAEAEAARLREEVASLRLTLGGRTFDASVPEPIGCPVPGACQTVAEIVRLREALKGCVMAHEADIYDAACAACEEAKEVLGMVPDEAGDGQST